MFAIYMIRTEAKISIEKKTKRKQMWPNVNDGWVNLGKDDMRVYCLVLETFLWV